VFKDGKFACLDGISCLKYLFFFINALLLLVLTFSFTFFLPHLNLSPITTKNIRPFDSYIACNILVMEMRLKSKFMVEHIH